MTRNFNLFPTEGTAALKPYEYGPAKTTQARIVKFPQRGSAQSTNAGMPPATEEARPRKAASRIRGILDSSEMYCSLTTEDFRGCRYNLFSTQGIQVLATAGSAIAIISLLLGV